ncbi:MAG: hypothetical protein ABIQ49_06890 [Gemmatimonadales bacterium]
MPLPPRTPAEEALVAEWRAVESVEGRLQRPPVFTEEPDGGIGLAGDQDLARARLDRVFRGNTGAYTGHMATLVSRALGMPDHVRAANVAVAMVHAIGPQDPVEVILASQMVAAHDAAMEMIRRARLDDQPSAVIDSCITRATRLMRTVTAQVVALKDYRSKGHQTVTVQHVDVRDGGQAIVGDVVMSTAGRGGGGT